MTRELQLNGKHDLLKEEKQITRQGIDMNRLIGRPHIFSRFCDTREGFMIVPIGEMTLQPDGRVTGYHHHNEGLWQPYNWGTVSGDRAFAFVGEGNRFIPSSTWQQTFHGMPVGFYCGEPEMPQKLCLVPQTSFSFQLQIIYVIASCLQFYEKTVPGLLHQLLAEGIEPDRIKVIVNGSIEQQNKTIENIEHVFTMHNAWELSALYEAPGQWRFDYAMLIHDTNHVYPGFRRRVETFNTHLLWDHLPATPLARCLLGLYSHRFLSRINNWLEKTDGITKKDAIVAEVAGELLQQAKTTLVLGDMETNGAARQTEWKETADFFNTGTQRIRRVFPSINLHKFTHQHLTDPKSL